MSSYYNQLLGLWITLATVLVMVATAIVVLAQAKAKREEEWKKTAAAHEARADAQEAMIKEQQVLQDDTRRELFDMTVMLRDTRLTNKRLGMQNLSQQMQIDNLRRRENQLMKALKESKIPIPEADGDEEE